MDQNFIKSPILLLEDDQAENYRCVVATPAIKVTPTVMNLLLSLSGGVPFVAISESRAKGFLLSDMIDSSRSSIGKSSFINGTVSVEAREGVHSGISTKDRAATVAILGMDNPNAASLVRPGHIFPTVARDGGVLVRSCIPEALIDLARDAGLSDATLYMDLLNSSGESCSRDQVHQIASEHKIAICTVSDVVRNRLLSERLVERVATTNLPTTIDTEFQGVAYRSLIDQSEHLVIMKGEISPEVAFPVRVQVEDRFSDIFGGSRRDSRTGLNSALTIISKIGYGALLYLRKTTQENLKSPGAVMREYGLGAQILRDLGIRKIELISATSPSISGLASFGLEISGYHPLYKD